MKTRLQKYSATVFTSQSESFLLLDRQVFAPQRGSFQDAPLPAITLREATRAPLLADRLEQFLDDIRGASRAGPAPTGVPVDQTAAPVPQPTSPVASDLVNTINFLLDDILGLDSSARLVEVVASRSTNASGLITIQIRYALGAWPTDLIESLSSLEIFSFDLNLDRLPRDGSRPIEVEAEIKEKLDSFVNRFIDERTADIQGPGRAVALAAANPLKDLLSSQILGPLSTLFANSLLDLHLPGGAEVGTILGSALDALSADYFKAFVPGIAKAYAKLGLTQILTTATAGLTPEWATAVNTLGNGVLGQVLDNLVTHYFAGPGESPVGAFDNVNFSQQLGTVLSDLLIDFEALDQEFIDDVLGLDGGNWIETQLGTLLNDGIRGFVQDTFADAIDFLGGDMSAFDTDDFFGDFVGQFDVAGLLTRFFAHYGPTDLAELFVDIEGLPEQLVSQMGAWLGSNLISGTIEGALSDAIGTFTIDALAEFFGSATANLIGTTLFNGLGTLLGAGVGTVAGSVIFELLDDLFDGAISNIIENILDFVQNESPQAFYETIFDPALNEFHWSGYEYSKDGSNELRLAVRSTMEAFQKEINTIIDFVGEPLSLDAHFDTIMFAWGKKHFNQSFASYIYPGEGNKLSYNASAEHVAKETIGAVLCHMNFHGGDQMVARAYDLWRTEVSQTSVNSLSYFASDALGRLQDLVGLARFANDYRQDPTYFDLLIASDTPMAITILQQYLEADVRGFNAATVLHGSVLGFETIGSAAAGDTIYLDGPAWRAIARGGNDTIHIGAASVQEIDGGTGVDTIVLGSRASYRVELIDLGTHTAILTDPGAGIRITVSRVETFQFSDLTVSLDQIFGDSSQNWLIGGSAMDNFFGAGGHDSLWGRDGDDILDAGLGDDTIDGGAGNDTASYLTATAGVEIDLRFIEDQLTRGAGIDTLISIENIQGSFYADHLTGNGVANRLDGYAGADVLAGLGGNDVYLVDQTGDQVIEAIGEGSDTVYSGGSYVLTAGAEVELLSARNQATTTAMNLTGNEFANEIFGNAGVNILDGGAAADRLWGLAGADQFAFTTAPGGGNVDLVMDFQTGTDKIVLENAVFAALGAGMLPAGAFRTGTTALDADDRILYDLATGALRYDADGSGAAMAVQFATLQGAPVLGAGDFLVI